LILITKQEMFWLIQNKYLRMYRGKYPDLVITCSRKRAKRKKRYVPETFARFLKGQV